MAKGSLARQPWGLIVGLGMTLAAMAVHLSGLTARFELLGYDWRVERFSRIPASDRILHIDIDDDALDRVGSWPWPRDRQANLVRILAELGAERIVMDIVFSEPTPWRIHLPDLEPGADVDDEMRQLATLSARNIIYPDDELAEAIATAGNVYLAMYDEDFEALGPPPPRRPGTHAAPGEAAAPPASETARRTDPPAAYPEPHAVADRRAALASVLREDVELDLPTAAQRLGWDIDVVEPIFAGVKRAVIGERVRAVLADNPSATVREVHEAVLTTPIERQTADRADVQATYHREISLIRLRGRCETLPEEMGQPVPEAGRIVPPIETLVLAARGVGFATFDPDVDGSTRHVVPIKSWDGRFIDQLGFAVARDLLGIEADDMRVGASGELIVAGRPAQPSETHGPARPAMRLPLDQHGRMLIPWHVVPNRRWDHSFEHLPVARLLQLEDCRRNMRENEARRQWLLGRAVYLVRDEPGFAAYRDRVNDMLKRDRRVRMAALRGELDGDTLAAARAEVEALRARVDAEHQTTITFIREMWAALQEEPDPEDPEIAEDYQRFREAHALVTEQVAELERVNAMIAAEEASWIARLKPMVEGKVCFVGYTATAVADMVTTPGYARAPGVLVHSNVFNAMLQGRFVTAAGRPTQLALIGLLGVLTTLLAAAWEPRQSLAVVLAAIIGLEWFSASVLFARMDYWLPTWTALASMFVVWALIVMVRFLVTDRQRRRFSRAVSQYVSPAMARQIARETTDLTLAPVNRVVTCFFSDLAGFTRISERLGPEGTRNVLNPYLERMSGVLHEHQAVINKFMGDGVFAFFNPPILPNADHEIAACESAIESLRMLEELARARRHDPLSEEFARLKMRIGLASGPVFVGDYGSEDKMDYTCVGDTVNLAARLESAGKQFGTQVLINGATRARAGERFMCRYLGLVQVQGQSVGVPVYELLGRRGEVNGDLLAFVETFESAVEAFARREWEAAASRLDTCLETRPDDLAARRYREAVASCRREPPADNWRGELILTEK